MSAREPLSLYIHIPFCKSKCAYCDFASFPGREAMWEAYFAALCGEIRAAGDDTHRVETVFFGGGTPSLVPETYIAGALAAAREAFPFAPGAEVSLEANPGTLTMEKLRAYREMGVNRLSIGVQSFDARLLKDIGRIHTPGEAVEAVRMAKAAGFANISIDLMYGLPGQTMGAWEATLETALSLPLAHISAYALIVEEGTPMAAREDELPGEEMVLAMQRRCTRALAAAGFARYEISNYARRRLCLPPQPRLLAAGGISGLWLRGALVFRRRALPQRLRSGGLPARRAGIGARARGRRGGARGDGDARNAHARRAVAGKLAARIWRGFLLGREKVLDKLRRAGLLDIADGHVYLTEKGMEVHNAVVLALL